MKQFYQKSLAVILVLQTIIMPTAYSEDLYETLAQSHFDRYDNIANTNELDNFIQMYKGTDQANIAFTIRFNLTRSSFDVGEYHNFIKLYSDTLAGKLAIFEVYDIIHKRSDIASYMDFMKRYPNANESIHAKLMVQKLLFNLAKDIVDNTEIDHDAKIQAIDDFISLNPDAVQVPAARMLANMLEVEYRLRSRANFESSHPEASLDRVCGLGSKELLAPTMQGWSFLDSYNLDEKLPSEALEVARRNDRLAFAINMVYPDCIDLLTAVRDEFRFQKITTLLATINTSILESNENLISKVQEQFRLTRETLEQMSARVEARLDTVVSGLEILHQDLQLVNRNIVILQEEVDNQTKVLSHVINQQTSDLSRVIATVGQKTQGLLAKQIKVTENLTEVIHHDLSLVHDSIEVLNRDMNQGFTVQTAAVNNLTDRVNQGFSTLLEEQQRTRVTLTNELRGGFNAVTGTLNQGFGAVVNRLDTQITQTRQFHYETLRQNEDLNNRLMDNMNRNTDLIVDTQISTSTALREDLGSRLDTLNTTVVRTSQDVIRSIYDNGDMTRNTVNRVGRQITSTIKTENKKVLYRLDKIDNSVQGVGEDIRSYHKDFNKFADRNNSLTAELLSVSKQAMAGAGVARGSDYTDAIGAILGTNELPSDIEGQLINALDQGCGEFNAANDYPLPCDDLRSMVEKGEVDYAVLSERGGEYLCSLAKDPNLPCDMVGDAFGEAVQNGGMPSLDTLGGIAVEYACQANHVQEKTGLSCTDLKNGAMIGTCFYSGDCRGVIDEAVSQFEDVAPSPLDQIPGAINDLGGSLGGFF